MKRTDRADNVFRVTFALTCATAFLAELLIPFASSQGAKPAADRRIVLDFSQAEFGGLSVGNFNNVAFPIRFSQPLAKGKLAFERVEREDLVASFDYASCSLDQKESLERPLAHLGRGDAAWVDAVEIEILPHPQKDLPWWGNVCFGVRSPAGAWTWYLDRVPLERQDDGSVHARLPIDKGPIDAIKLVFDGRMPRHFLREVAITARPIRER